MTTTFEGNREQLDLLRRASATGDPKIWNDWRQENPAAIPDLRRLEMPGAILPGVDLSKANLSHANLQDADLRGAKLSGATLIYAQLQRAKLDKAQIFNANLVC